MMLFMAPVTPPLSRPFVLLLALATGLVVANLYYVQPLLDVIAQDFGVSARTAGMLVTLTQLGYALGLLLIVPLGDAVPRRPLVVCILGFAVLALVAIGLAPNLTIFALLSVGVGLASVVAQILVPLAAALAPAEMRGRVVGTVMSGLLLGVLLARTVAGAVAEVAGWRSIYFLAAVLMLILAVALWRALPHESPRPLHYPALLASVFRLARDEPVLRLRALYGALGFGAFSIFWTSLAFLLARPPYGYSEAVIGLFGLVGAAGALAAGGAGRLADRGYAGPVTLSLGLITLASFGFIGLGAHVLWALIVGALLLDLGVQALQIINQSEIYRLNSDARSRVTTVYLTTYFLGGAVGSALSGLAYSTFGWLGVAGAGGLCGLAIVVTWLLVRGRNHAEKA